MSPVTLVTIPHLKVQIFKDFEHLVVLEAEVALF
jgi:hypothetical protein